MCRERILAAVPRALLGLSLALILTGCGGSDQKATATVTGTVTHDGKPVPGGGLTFSPIGTPGQEEPPGKPATGTIGPDGKYELSTYGEGDGAVVGKHRITFAPPAPPAAAEPAEGQHVAETPKSPYAGLVPKTPEVEVTDGTNTIDIELVAPAGGM